MRRHTSHISRHDVRLDAITLNRSTIPSMTDRIEQIEHARRAFTVAQVGEGPPDPDRCVCVLPPILPNARRIRLDVPGVPTRLREWGRQQSHEPLLDVDEFTLSGA
jgi:hypothetical protein